ncbi:restriction endonuclease [Butyrivibrio sp. AE3009]|uniref:restriction endonuclease n=1 Tax=Butyrivibrio sp. AE3009 TaxID=1280666 RepID=UPI0003B59A58|nr:restriction endonuclease [Butyrivibrio sp. AE3009]
MEVQFDDLDKSDLILNCIYKGGKAPNMSAEPFHKLIPECENSGGFRKRLRQDGSGKYAYIVLYTSLEEPEWPDSLDEQTGVFRYFGDNREPGRALLDTKKKGNLVLKTTFDLLNDGFKLEDIPPFLIFKKTGHGRDIQFLGLAAPGNPNIVPGKDLFASWKKVNDKTFQNYEAYFTILDTGKTPISREWIKALIYDHRNNLNYAPVAWKKFVREGRNGIVPLRPHEEHDIPNKYDQLQSDEEGMLCLKILRDHYRGNKRGFEVCAANIVCKMDTNFQSFASAGTWTDGANDIVGKYIISQSGKVNVPLSFDCALEAKCSDVDDGVGVKDMSRLISRLKNRQMGVFITTSFVDEQAYYEVVENGYPILLITASDIAAVLRNNSISSRNIYEWLESVDSTALK